MRAAFDAQLESLQQEMLRMAEMAVKAITQAVTSLQNQDPELAHKVITDDVQVDALDLDLERRCQQLLALQSPLARDLRIVASVMRISTDIERLADLATNIAEITIKIGKTPLIKPLEDIPRMAEMAQAMVRDSLEAFVKRDAELARDVCQRDNEVDQLYSMLHDELMEFISESDDPQKVEQAANLLFVARYLERIADHATNIGERVIYMVTGQRESY